MHSALLRHRLDVAAVRDPVKGACLYNSRKHTKQGYIKGLYQSLCPYGDKPSDGKLMITVVTVVSSQQYLFYPQECDISGKTFVLTNKEASRPLE